MSFRVEQEIARIVSGINMLADKLATLQRTQEQILAELLFVPPPPPPLPPDPLETHDSGNEIPFEQIPPPPAPLEIHDGGSEIPFAPIPPPAKLAPKPKPRSKPRSKHARR